jgi:antitoxin ParD1/3/4
MNISLTPELEKLIQEKVASGLYQTASEVIREGLRLLKERDDRQTTTLREAIQEGLTQLEQGAYQDYTDATLKELAQGVKQRGRERLATHQKPV